MAEASGLLPLGGPQHNDPWQLALLELEKSFWKLGLLGRGESSWASADQLKLMVGWGAYARNL